MTIDVALPAGWRLDPETREPLRPGVMTRKESREWWAASRRRWMAWSFAEKPPAEGRWVKVWSVGWTRERVDTKSKKENASQ